MSRPIEDYALIGDCETAALVSRDGSIDWLCWPRFDSAACFAALLGTPEHGRWRIAPRGEVREVRRSYRGDTLILETCFRTDDGEALLTDFMPPRDPSATAGRTPFHGTSDLMRIVRGVRGRVRMRMELILRFDYGAIVPWVSRLPDGALRAVAGQDMTVLRTDVELKGENLHTVAEFDVDKGESPHFTLTYGPSHLPSPTPLDPRSALRKTERFWSLWAGCCKPVGEYSPAVTRSLITLKALTYAPTGGLVAAPTTSLPEDVGGERNWDYRFCWLRDATLTLLALMNSGFYEEAKSWRDWLLRAAAGSPDQIQIMYGLAGERRLAEWNATWLPGYENSLPVRIGNAAYGQLQLDVFGEVMDALHQGRKAGLGRDAGWELQRALVTHLENVWERPDQGIWEVRGGARHFTYSKAMAWVALDRAVRTIENFGLDGPIDRWRALRQRIHHDVCTKGFDVERGSFVQSYGSRALDASLLLLSTTGFLPHRDERMVGTVAAVERHLLRDGFVLRYDTGETDDGLAGEEGAFLPCSFWLADAWLMQGRQDDARALFERLLALRNDVGLLAEEYDPRLERQVGNFPQAFSHIALINTAHNLAGVTKPAEQRCDPGAPPS